MTAEKHQNKYIFNCDSCREEVITGEKHFFQAWKMAEAKGWVTVSGEGTHHCPACVAKMHVVSPIVRQ